MAGHNNNERRQSGWFGAPNLFMTPAPNFRLQPPPNTHHHDDGVGSGSGGGAVSGGRRPRGRPPGSRNKPKSPVMVMRENPHALHAHVLEVSSGADIMQTLVDYTRRRALGVCIQSGSGMVSHVTLHQPGAPPGTVVTLRGRFQILSISGTVLPRPPTVVLPRPPVHMDAIAEGLSVYLSGGQGSIIGGIVVAPLITWGPVFLMAGTFSNAVFERLPLPSEDRQRQPPSSTSHSSSVTSTGHMAEGGGGAPFVKSRNTPISSSSSATVPGNNLFG